MSISTTSDLAKKYDFGSTEAAELHRLITDMSRLNFRDSEDLSRYSVKHKLGYRYPNISGIVRMRGAGNEWDFHGGFLRHIYRIVCEKLDLEDRGTNAESIGFKSFKNIQEKQQRTSFSPDDDDIPSLSGYLKKSFSLDFIILEIPLH